MDILNKDIFGINTIAIANPGAGNNLDHSFSQFARFQIVALNFTLTADVTVATRIVRLKTVSDTYSCNYAIAPGGHTASESLNYYFGLGLANQDLSGTLGLMTVCLPDDLIVQKDDDFESDVLNLQAGDAITNIRIRYKYWWTT